MGRRRTTPKSSDYTMSLWPDDLDIPTDRINPYPCCSCKELFRSTKALRTHPCQPNRKKTVSA